MHKLITTCESDSLSITEPYLKFSYAYKKTNIYIPYYKFLRREKVAEEFFVEFTFAILPFFAKISSTKIGEFLFVFCISFNY